jgi:FKBP-type peptidyl-prolyl cis-trans isomerase SlyD
VVSSRIVKVTKGETIRVEYELKVAGKGGEVIESSKRSGPLTYVHGEGKMLPGLEKRLEGMAAGEEKRGTIPAAEAFGTEASLPIKELPRKEFPKDEKLEVGRLFQARGPNGQPVSFKIVSEGKDVVKVRFLHPLVDKDIEFYVKVLMIDDPKNKKRATVAPPPPPADAVLEDEK